VLDAYLFGELNTTADMRALSDWRAAY